MKYSSMRPIPSAVLPVGNNMHICFGRHTGYGGYSDWMRGGRHIVVDEDLLGSNVVETWNRLEDGSVSGHVVLNATYSKDRYPLVELEKSFADGSVEGGSSEMATLTTATSSMQGNGGASAMGSGGMISSRDLDKSFDTTWTTTQTTITAPSTTTVSATMTAATSKSPSTVSTKEANESARKLPLRA
jgi:hypothetical protein